VCIENIYFWTILDILECHYNILKTFFLSKCLIIFLSQYCVQKCLVCIRPKKYMQVLSFLHKYAQKKTAQFTALFDEFDQKKLSENLNNK